MKLKKQKVCALTISLSLILFFLLLITEGCKKSGTGTIFVTVVDQQLIPLKGVSVTITSGRIPEIIKKTTSLKGTCMFFSLPPGNNYTVKLKKRDFISQSRKKVRVVARKKTSINVFFEVNTKIIPGRWRISRTYTKTKRLNAKQKESIKKLETISYLAGHKIAPKTKNITIHSKKRVFKGLNLYCSGSGPEAILMDMKGTPLHRWYYDITQISKDKFESKSSNHLFWRRLHLMEDGYLLAIIDGYCLIKLDKDSNLIWSYSGKTHHDLFVMPDGKIYVLTRKATINPRYNKTEPILEDFIAVLSPKGEEIQRVSILKCIENSNYTHILDSIKKSGDILHTNTIEVLNGKLSHRSSAFKRGNVLISFLYLNLIGIVDMEKESLVWAMSGMWRWQHQPTVLDNGNMLIFDNQFGTKPMVSRILEFDPFTKHILWEYRGSEDTPFFTWDCGSCQRLPNGNTLISESNSGRAFEVTPDKTIVWEFYNPNRAGKNKELIATLFEMIRIGPDYKTDWLKSSD